jgi:hypothetical protein
MKIITILINKQPKRKFNYRNVGPSGNKSSRTYELLQIKVKRKTIQKDKENFLKKED